MLVLGIESSCDETAVALLRDRAILSSHIASQETLHAPFGGVVPELASRRHLEMLPYLVEQTLHEAHIAPAQLDGIAVTRAPGLIGCLLVGLSFAKAYAQSLDKPLIGVNHLEAHLQVAALTSPDVAYPFLGLVVSGGHTSLYLAHDLGRYELLGATRDDAAGEAYDKIAKLMGLGYPGGPLLDQLAATGNPRAVPLPRPKLKVTGSHFEIGAYDFSFSGLKTAVGTLVTNQSASLADIAAGFQRRVILEIADRLERAATATGCRHIVVAGGVAANQGLRAHLAGLAQKNNWSIHIPPLAHCTDNAVMIAWTGVQYLAHGITSPANINAAASEELHLLARGR